MGSAALLEESMTFEEFLDFAETAEGRHEFVGGVVYAMTGGTDWHNIVSLNLASLLTQHLKGNPYRAYMSDMGLKARSGAKSDCVYPDIMVCCDPKDNARRFRTSPTFIAQVASPSTERTDRKEKFDAFRAIPTLKDYAITQSETPRIELFSRARDWQATILRLDDEFRLDSIGFAVPVRDLYEDIDYL